jgi:ABC-type nitrate/sulfonate/bicarbonate transport system permease component
MNRLARANMPGFALLAGLLVIWEIATLRGDSPNAPDIVRVMMAFSVNAQMIAGELARTLARAGVGLAIAIVTMIIAGLVIGRVAVIRSIIVPIVELLRPIPPVAIAPVAMLFAGTGSSAKIAVIVYGCAFPVLINTIDAVRSIHPLYTLVASSFGMSRMETMIAVDLPAALPRILVGVRTSVALSLLMSVVSEMILSSDGLGNLIIVAQQRYEIALEVAIIGVIVAVGILISLTWNYIERRLIAWHYGYLGRNE